MISKSSLSGKEIRGNYAGEYYDSDSSKMKHSKYLEKKRKFRDEIFFCFNMLLTYASIAIVFTKPLWFPKLNTISVIILMIHRIYEFTFYKWQFYLIDFCYLVNLSVILFSEIFENNFNVFIFSFGFSLGPILLAIFIYKWGFVYHNSIKFTSLWTHFSPGLSMFIFRWYNENIFNLTNAFIFAEKENYIHLQKNIFKFDFYNLTFIRIDSIFSFIKICSMLYIPWFLIYYIIIFHFFYKFIIKNGYETQYNYIMQNKNDRRHLIIFGDKYTGIAFMFLHIRYVLLTLIFSYLFLFSFHFGLIVLIACVITSIWVTSTYYIEYFSENYKMQFSLENNLKKLTPV